MGRCVGITVYKGWSRVGAWTGTLKNPTKCLWRWEPDRRSNFFSPPAHLCAVTYMTEISLIVTLNRQFNNINNRSVFNNECFPEITRKEYAKGYSIYVFQLTSTEDNTSCNPLIKRGHTRIELKFARPLTETVTL